MNTPINSPLLHQYWFNITSGLGIGVTVFSLEEARSMAEVTLRQINPQDRITSVIENIDVQSLDENHILPNIGPVVIHGVWYPRRNI